MEQHEMKSSPFVFPYPYLKFHCSKIYVSVFLFLNLCLKEIYPCHFVPFGFSFQVFLLQIISYFS